MELIKNKYKKKEVELLLQSPQDSFNDEKAQLKEEFNSLKEENEKLLAKLSDFKEKEEVIKKTLYDTKEYANKVEAETNFRYYLEVEKLKRFSEKWKDYFEYLKNNYPSNSDIIEREKIISKLKNVFDKKSNQEIIEELLAKINKTENVPFDPKKKMEEFIINDTNKGFNLQDVLNPGDLKLEDLCKELGLMDEN